MKSKIGGMGTRIFPFTKKDQVFIHEKEDHISNQHFSLVISVNNTYLLTAIQILKE